MFLIQQMKVDTAMYLENAIVDLSMMAQIVKYLKVIYEYILDCCSSNEVDVTTGQTECQRYFICSERGTCTAEGRHHHTCHCNNGFTGRNCEVNIDDCHPNPCFNNGRCLVRFNGTTEQTIMNSLV